MLVAVSTRLPLAATAPAAVMLAATTFPATRCLELLACIVNSIANCTLVCTCEDKLALGMQHLLLGCHLPSTRRLQVKPEHSQPLLHSASVAVALIIASIIVNIKVVVIIIISSACFHIVAIIIVIGGRFPGTCAATGGSSVTVAERGRGKLLLKCIVAFRVG